MKIAVVGLRGFPGVQGGIEKHCEKLYSYLVRKGCDITVFTRESYINYPHNIYEGIKFIPVSCPQNKFLEAFVHTFKCVLKARSLHPDILHIHGIGPSIFTPLARILGMNVVVTHHGPDYLRDKWSLPAKVFLKVCERAGVRCASEVIVIAENIEKDIKECFGRYTAVIPNGVEIPEMAQSDDILSAMNIQKKKYVLAVGRFVPEKGFHDLIQAFNDGDFNDWKLVIVGDADHEDDYSRELRLRAEQNNNILLTGKLMGQPLHELYSHAGLFVLPSYFEGLPIVLLEAMSYGLPCIASDIPSNKNIKLSDDRFFTPGDVTLLADKIKHFINIPRGERERKAQVEMIAETYNWKTIADKTFEIYKKTVA